MFTLGSSHSYQLYNKACDMGKSFNALAGLVRNELATDPLKGDVFIFINKHRNFIKLLHWQEGGFVLYYKKLEKGTFTLAHKADKQAGKETISWPELVLMIAGIELEGYKQKERFKKEV